MLCHKYENVLFDETWYLTFLELFLFLSNMLNETDRLKQRW